MRGLKNPYTSTILGYQNDEKAIINFVETVTKHFPISHRFYAVKAKLLKLKTLGYQDRAASVGATSKKYSFEEAGELITTAFERADPKFAEILQSYLKNGQIDVYSKKGKRGGAYCASDIGIPTFVLLNYVGSPDSVSTFAHEMGHAIHAEYSKKQSPIYERHTISVAEVASTLFENFAFDEMLQTLSEKEKVVALHDKIQDDVQTIFRQIAVFNFEVELHNLIRQKGALSKEEIANLMNKHMGSYLGPKFKLTELDGYFFVGWAHIRYFFYVYSYAYGQLISKALYNNYKKDKKYIEKIKQFLSAGDSKSPEDIFKEIGIDTSKPQFFIDGLKSIEEDIARLEKMI